MSSKHKDIALYAQKTREASNSLLAAQEVLTGLFLTNPGTHKFKCFDDYGSILEAMANELEKEASRAFLQLERMPEEPAND